MLRYTVRSVLAHKARLLLTAAAIVLGVAMVAGTFILLDTAEAGGRDLAQGRHRVDVTVRAVPSEEEVFSDETGEFVPGPPMPLSTVERAARIAGVASAVGVTVGDARLIARDGHVDGGRAPLGRSIDASFVPDLRAGRVPGRAGEIVVDRATADDEGIGVGDRVRILVSGGEPRGVAVVGVLDSPEFTDEVALVGFDPATARRLLGASGTVGFIEVHAAPGIGERRLRDGVASALGGGHQAFTGAALASERTRPDDLIRQILLVASAVALFTGAFLIRNTFSITLAARTRELALLRCVGAGRGQLRRSILLEAAIVGAVAAALGLVARRRRRLGPRRAAARRRRDRHGRVRCRAADPAAHRRHRDGGRRDRRGGVGMGAGATRDAGAARGRPARGRVHPRSSCEPDPDRGGGGGDRRRGRGRAHGSVERPGAIVLSAGRRHRDRVRRADTRPGTGADPVARHRRSRRAGLGESWANWRAATRRATRSVRRRPCCRSRSDSP
ncbi:ABC transporter permease [Actinomadura madurae]|uniref:ABC transporter permease n=1 Tax=Actinomadura madurae TaxID=1993 RepID=UPI0020D1FF57|nr:ABC transporter permease [Actinomadura madurae]MCP9970991.1 ABC transporter permease [Actinomadura madurae]